MTEGSPGPVCGWSLFEEISANGPTSFSPGSLVQNSSDTSQLPGVKKSATATIVSVFGKTAQIFFEEGVGAFYHLFTFTNEGNTDQLYIQMEPSGYFLIEVGPTGNQSFYEGTWAPGAGLRKLAVVVSAIGVPTAFVDGVEIPLTFTITTGGRGSYPGNSVFVVSQNSAEEPAEATIKKIFFATGSQADATFCCP